MNSLEMYIYLFIIFLLLVRADFKCFCNEEKIKNLNDRLKEIEKIIYKINKNND